MTSFVSMTFQAEMKIAPPQRHSSHDGGAGFRHLLTPRLRSSGQRKWRKVFAVARTVMDRSLLSEFELEMLDYSESVGLVPYAGTPRRSAEQHSDDGDNDVVPAGDPGDNWRMLTMD